MGEYVRHPTTGDEIKIGTMDHCFYSREDLLKLLLKGYKGFYAREFDVDAGRKCSLKRMLADPATLYAVPDACPFEEKIHTVRVEENGLEHDAVIALVKGNRGSAYVYKDLKCVQEGLSAFYAVLIGERYDEKGRVRSIFKCDCCGKFFSLTLKEAERQKGLHPYWADWIHANPADPGGL